MIFLLFLVICLLKWFHDSHHKDSNHTEQTCVIYCGSVRYKILFILFTIFVVVVVVSHLIHPLSSDIVDLVVWHTSKEANNRHHLKTEKTIYLPCSPLTTASERDVVIHFFLYSTTRRLECTCPMIRYFRNIFNGL